MGRPHDGRRRAEQAAREYPFLVRRLAEDEFLRTRVETARRLGISLRRLDGWVGACETVHEYNEYGQIVRSRTWTESEWSPEQSGWMLALAQHEASLCGGCGLPAVETFDTANTFAYEADEPWICHACVAKDKGAKRWAEKNDLTSGHRFIPELHPERRCDE